MDKENICTIMEEAFKSLTLHKVEIVELSKPILKVRVVAEGYASSTIPERIVILANLLRSHIKSESFKKYAISYDPLTQQEYNEWYESDEIKPTDKNEGEKNAAKDAEL